MTKANPSPFHLERLGATMLVWLDVPGQKFNSLGATFPSDLERLCEHLDALSGLHAVVFLSRKVDSFIVGADVGMLEQLTSAEEATALAAQAQRALSRLEGLRAVTVAAIHGPCLGGGLEFALACTSRVATKADVTRLGLPEVQLGLLPGSGGTQRLPRLIGLSQALDLMLTGRKLSAPKALKANLIDLALAPEGLVQGALAHAAALVEGRALKRAKAPIALKGLGAQESDMLRVWTETQLAPARALITRQALKAARRQTKGHYPAPEAIVACARFGLEAGMEEGLAREAKAFGELWATPESRALLWLFQAQNALKRDSGVSEALPPQPPLARVGVLGAGLMGAGIAYVSAHQAGCAVRLKDRDEASVLAGLRRVGALLGQATRKKRLSAHQAEVLRARIGGCASYAEMGPVDVMIEAVFEDLELKRRIVKEVEEADTRNEAIFASNTSSLPISDIAAASAHPERVIGMHYFSPVDKMPLLEVIATRETSPEVVARCVALGKAQGKTVIVVNDGVGFYTTRVLVPFMNEAARILSEGVPIEVIDNALTDFGFPVGPIKLIDEVGVDVAYKVCKITHGAFGARMEPPPLIEAMLEAKRLGRKGGKGFYDYSGEKRSVDEEIYALLGVTLSKDLPEASDIAKRCVLGFVNECVRTFEEGILRSARDGDVGAVFGLGFPPFLGGPFHYVDLLGAATVVSELEALEARLGARFKPAPLLRSMARDARTFFGKDSAITAPAAAA